MTLRRAWYLAALLAYLALACYQLGLPGLHYDEAREAGVNAMEILTGAPISAFRGAGIVAGGRTFPLMVQDYIGALNVYLALPLLAITGIGVPNLRLLPVLTGLVGLIFLERAVSMWVAPGRTRATPISLAGLIALTLLAVSPSYVFWARQGIFVTNLVLPFVFLCLWQGLGWLHSGRRAALWLAALAAGLALCAKLLAAWVIGPFALLLGSWWLLQRRRHPATTPALPLATVGVAALLFLLPLAPLLLFNLQTGGTLASIGSNVQESYYGVDNANLAHNLPIRLGQVRQMLTGEQFWYLGGSFANAAAPWLALLAVAAGLWRNWRQVLPPLLLLILAFGASLFTISDLFVTHYVLLQPLAVAVVAIAAGNLVWPGRLPRLLLAGLVALWLLLDVTASLRYHAALAASGGLADHSDATYHLAYHLRYNGMGAPVALDWGMDAPVRYLSQGSVTPVEIFGYASPAAPDDAFPERLAPFLANPDNRYLLHAPGATVFQGRREAFLAAVEAMGAQATREIVFGQRDGTPLYEIWRVAPGN